MKIELSSEQFELVKDIVREYTDSSYANILEYNKFAKASDDETVRDYYLSLAADEEEKYDEARELRGYLDEVETED